MDNQQMIPLHKTENTCVLEQAAFKVYSTNSIDNFLKLYTRNGKNLDSTASFSKRISIHLTAE